MKNLLPLYLLFFFPPLLLAQEWTNLLDQELSNWDTWIGVPYPTVQGIPDYPKDENPLTGTPIGAKDPKNVFSVISTEEGPLLRVSGEIYGALTSKQIYENFHLKFRFKWGSKKWDPHTEHKRNGGILHHCHGENATFWNVWMSSLECQGQSGDCGDLITLGNVSANVPAVKRPNGLYQFTPNATPITFGDLVDPYKRHCQKYPQTENPSGEWNTVEVLSIGTTTIHVVNETVVMVLYETRYLDGDQVKPLKKGKIQIQSEGAELFYSELLIRPLESFPKKYAPPSQPSS